MANGAAGCGYEFTEVYNEKACIRSIGYVCQFLNEKAELFGTTFTCTKFQIELEKDERDGHPWRCKKCSNEADAYWMEIYLKNRKRKS